MEGDMMFKGNVITAGSCPPRSEGGDPDAYSPIPSHCLVGGAGQGKIISKGEQSPSTTSPYQQGRQKVTQWGC